MELKLTEAVKKTQMSRSRLEMIAKSRGVSLNGKIPRFIVDEIVNEQETYISFREFAAIPRGSRYDGTLKCRKKLLEELEINNYHGIDVIDYEDLLIGQNRDIIFFCRSDVANLESKLSCFFDTYALSEHEKVCSLLTDMDKVLTKQAIKMYGESIKIEETTMPSYTEFVAIARSLPDIPNIENSDIERVLGFEMSASARMHLVSFLNFARKYVDYPRYSRLQQVRKESYGIPAYSDDAYIALARCLFNPEYIAKHKMIERALENHLFIEMWLYLSLHYCCSWRAADICRGWRYLNLKEKPDNAFGINTETLYEDILNDRISDTVYEDVCRYATNSISLSGQMPSKTAGPKTKPLVISITPELATFFGLLTLISESVMLRTGDGYMKPNRETMYQKMSNYRKFFGQEMYDILQGQNIHSRRLNKDYLQGLEETARHEGCGSLMASAVASFARRHNNLDTISHYLRDHQLNAENAGMVLYFMLERGVFGFEIYQTLLTAYPEALRKLPLKKQNQIMTAVTKTPYQIELTQSGLATKMYIKEHFEAGDEKEVIKILKGMYEITQGRGQGKDEGIHCLCRAEGGICKFPEFDSCLANACPYLVFTRWGYKALLEIIVDYKKAADEGNIKMKAVLADVIIPRFQNILNELMREVNMNRTEKGGLRGMLQEALDNEN